jgi:predicted Zn-dependent protease
MQRRHVVTMVATAAIFAGTVSCSINPVTHTPDFVVTSEKGEIEKARKLHPLVLQSEGGAYNDPTLQKYVNDVGQRIAKVSQRSQLEYTFTVIDQDSLNAMTTGGGYVYVYRGLLKYLNSEAELSAVLGHEIGHVNARHPVKAEAKEAINSIGSAVVGIATGVGELGGLTNMLGEAVVQGYGRDNELEADRLGAEYLAKEGYNPEAMIDVVRLLKNQEMTDRRIAVSEHRDPPVEYHGVFSTHPDNDTRLHDIIEAAHKVKRAGDELDPGRERYLRAIDGIPYSFSSAQGVLKGNRFYHVDLGFTLAFPSGWHVQNTPDRLVGLSADRNSMMQVESTAPPPNVGPKELLGMLLSKTSSGSVEPLEVNGLQGYTAVVRSATSSFGNTPARIAVIYYNNLAYVFSGVSRGSSEKPAADAIFMSTIKTFRRLKDNEFEAAEPYKIRIITASADTTIEGLAKTSPIDHPVERLRLLNDIAPNEQPKPGQLLKIVQ